MSCSISGSPWACALGSVVVCVALLGCSSEGSTSVTSLRPASDAPAASGEEPAAGAAASSASQGFVLASITIDADGNRISYAQRVDVLEGHFDNSQAIEAPGNAVFMTHGSDFFY